MKNKILPFALLWLFTAIFSLSGFSQSTVQIGTGTSTSGRVPIRPGYDYSYTQVIYLQSEINTTGDITELKWYFHGSSLSNSNNWDIYIGHTTKTAFASTSDWIAVSSLTQVWSGTFADPGGSGWITFDITDFNYNNTENLVIAVDENAALDNSYSDVFYCTSVGTYRGLSEYGSTNINPASPPSGNRRSYIANIILVFGNTACPTPTNQTVTNITKTSADLGWTENGTATAWDIEYGATGYTQGTGTTITGVTTNPYTLSSGLSAGTAYDWYVRASCGGSGVSTWAGPNTFSTLCNTVTTYPWTEDFENGGAMPICWSQEYVVGSHDWVFHTGGYLNSNPATAHGGTYNACFAHTSTNTKTKLITPQFDLSGQSNPQVTFWHTQTSYEGDIDQLRVYYKTTSGGAWTMIAEYLTSISTWTQRVLNLPNPSATYYIAFEGLDKYGYGVCVDDVEVSVSSCPAPSNLFVNNITKTSASLNWTTGGATTWNIEWGATGFTLGTGTPINGTTTNPQALSGLTAGTTYDFYVQDDCGAGSQSSWTGPSSFTTLCNAITAFPYTQNFENAGNRPDCWTEEYNVGSHDWVFQDGGDFEPISAHGGSYNAAFTHQSTGSSTKLILPELNLSTLTNPQISFYHAQVEDFGDQDELRVYYKTSQGGTWTLIPGATYTSNVSAWTQRILSLPSVNATYFVAFEGTDNYGQGVCIDDVTVDGTISCLPPTDLYADNITTTSAKLNWTTGGATTWNIEWGAKDFVQGTGTMITGSTTNPHSISGLTANTLYDFYVRDNCGASQSTWTGPQTFCAAINSFPWTENFENAGNRPDCWTEEYVTNTKDWVFTTGGESNEPPAAYGGTYNAAFNQGYVGNETMLITPTLDISSMINPELKFWHTQKAWQGQNTLTVYYKTTESGSWTIVPGGEYTSDITDWTSESLALPSPSSTYQIAFKGTDGGGYSVCLDDVCVGKFNTMPSNQTESNLTPTTADLNWDENGSATVWDIKWCPYNMGFNNATTNTGVSKPYTLSGLDENESYDWWVKAQCPESCDGDSDWAGLSTFTTSCEIETLPYVESFESLLNVGRHLYPTCMAAMHDPGFSDTDWTTANQEYTYHREPHTGTQYIYTEDLAHDWLFTQPINLNGGTSYNFSLWYITGGANNWDDITVLYGTEQTIAAMTTDTIAYDTSFSHTQYEKLSGSFTAPTTDTYYIGIHVHSNIYTTYLTIDDIKLEQTPTCPQPENQDTYNYTQTSVVLSWTEPGNAQIWDIEYGSEGFACGTGTRISGITAKPHTLNGLSPNTCYDWYVRTDCTGDDYSFWEGPNTFCTSITSFPYTESFENGVPPDCWNITEVSWDGTGDHPEWDHCLQTFFTHSNPPDGSRIAYFNSYYCSSGDQARLETPHFDFSSSSNMAFSFWMYHDDGNSSNNDEVQVQIKLGSGSWQNLETEILRYSTADGWSKHTYDLSAYDGSNITIGFLATSQNGDYMHIDRIEVHNQSPATASWTGTTDNNWYDAGNWSTSDISYPTTNVTIPEGLTNYPTIATRGGECNNIILKSSATGDASLLDNTYLTVNGTATVERYIPQYVGSAGWHFLSSPVSSQAVQTEFVTNPPATNDDFYYWNETTNLWINSKNDAGAWNTGFDANFGVGKGYMVAYTANVTKNFIGIFNNAAVSPSVTYTTGQGDGWNLVGNPFPSAIDWDDAGWTKTNISGSVYVYDGAAGQYKSWNGTTGNLTDGIILPMNGMFVEATGASPALTIPLSARTHGSQSFYKNGELLLTNHLIIEVAGNDYSDKTFIHFRDDATNGWDNDFDAYKLKGIHEAPQLYSFVDEISASINSNPFDQEQEEVMLGMEVGAEGNYTLSASGMETFYPGMQINLHDLKEGNVQDLRYNSIYQFSAFPEDEAKRFKLIFYDPAFDVDEIYNQEVKIRISDNQIYIDFTTPKAANVELFNLNGQLLFSKRFSPSNTHIIKLNHKGFLILRIRTNESLITKKIILL